MRFWERIKATIQGYRRFQRELDVIEVHGKMAEVVARMSPKEKREFAEMIIERTKRKEDARKRVYGKFYQPPIDQ